jgi:hypothetical protein
VNSAATLKTIIALNGNKRLPQYEAEIFTDQHLSCIYLSALRNDDCFANIDCWMDCCQAAYWYAVMQLCAPWPEAEHIIRALPPYAKYYDDFLHLLKQSSV